MTPSRTLLQLLAIASLMAFAGCARMRPMSDEECMARAMYFESNRSSDNGMLAVGTVVMNRLHSGKYPSTVCGVVGQRNQFAPGVLTKSMGKGRDLAFQMARIVLRGGRHPSVQRAMFFHTAGYSYPYTNMHYVAVLGGNAFYEKRKNATATQASVTPSKEGRLPYMPPQREAVVAEVRARPQLQPVARRSNNRQAYSRPLAMPESTGTQPLSDAQLLESQVSEPTSVEDVIRQDSGLY